MENRFSSWLFNFEDSNSYGISTSVQGKIELGDEVQTINQSILMILGTELGERVMNPDFGCEINKIIYAPLDDTTLGLAKYYVEKALKRWEKRIDLVDIDVNYSDKDPGKLIMVIKYKIKKSNTNSSVIYNYDITGER